LILETSIERLLKRQNFMNRNRKIKFEILIRSVRSLQVELHSFYGTWLRYNSLEWNNHSASLCLALHPKNSTFQPVQLRFPG